MAAKAPSRGRRERTAREHAELQMRLHSPLYCRFNGFALGAFLAGSSLPLAGPRFGAMRRRVHEFLAEIGVETRLPSRHAAYSVGYAELFDTLKAQVRGRSELLHDFMGIGAMTVLYAASGMLTTRRQRSVLHERWITVLVRHDLDARIYERFVRGIAASAPTHDASTLLSHAFGLVTELIEPLEAEADTCFIAMPFRSPFVGYFGSYYRPALARAGFRAIRAWGGISSEEYYPFVGTLISRCGAVFAELATLNLNVINEIGLAHGANRQTFLVMPRQTRDPPSNIARLPIFQYSAGEPGWQSKDAPRLARFIRWEWKHYIASLAAENLIEDAARQLVRYLRVASRPVSEELLALAGLRA